MKDYLFDQTEKANVVLADVNKALDRAMFLFMSKPIAIWKVEDQKVLYMGFPIIFKMIASSISP